MIKIPHNFAKTKVQIIFKHIQDY